MSEGDGPTRRQLMATVSAAGVPVAAACQRRPAERPPEPETLTGDAVVDPRTGLVTLTGTTAEHADELSFPVEVQFQIRRVESSDDCSCD